MWLTALSTAVGQRRLAAVITTALSRLLEHGRRASCGPVWDVCTAAAAQALAGAAGAASPVESTSVAAPAPATPAAALTHAVAYLAHLAEFFRGSRVPDFAPLFRALRTLLADAAAWPTEPPTDLVTVANGADAPPPMLVLSNPEETTPVEAFSGATTPGQVLRLALAITQSHGQVAGASGGPQALRAAMHEAGGWAALFERAPRREFEAFAAALLQPATPPDAAAVLLPQTLAELERRVARAGRNPAMLDVPLGLLMHALAGGAASAPAFITPTAVRGVAAQCDASVPEHAACVLAEALGESAELRAQLTGDPMHAAVALGALQWLRRAQGAEASCRAVNAALAIFRAAAAALAREPDGGAAAAGSVGDDATVAGGIAGVRTIATSLEGYAALEEALPAVVAQAACRAVCDAAARTQDRAGASADGCHREVHGELLRVLGKTPGNFAGVAALADLCDRGGIAGAGVFGTQTEPAADLETAEDDCRTSFREGLQCNLRAASCTLREETLRVLLRDAEEPRGIPGASADIVADARTHDSGDEDDGGDGAGDPGIAAEGVSAREQVVRGFLGCEQRQLGLQGGRAAVAWLRRVAAMLEYGHVPADTVALCTLCLLGMTHLKYGELRCGPSELFVRVAVRCCVAEVEHHGAAMHELFDVHPPHGGGPGCFMPSWGNRARVSSTKEAAPSVYPQYHS